MCAGNLFTEGDYCIVLYYKWSHDSFNEFDIIINKDHHSCQTFALWYCTVPSGWGLLSICQPVSGYRSGEEGGVTVKCPANIRPFAGHLFCGHLFYLFSFAGQAWSSQHWTLYDSTKLWTLFLRSTFYALLIQCITNTRKWIRAIFGYIKLVPSGRVHFARRFCSYQLNLKYLFVLNGVWG